MKIFLDSVDFNSRSGPNSFGLKLANQLTKDGHRVNLDESPDIQLSFILASQNKAPIVQRLDGIYFNSDQDWERLNVPIRETHKKAAGVIYQSDFNKLLTEKYFGKKEFSTVIRNGTDLEAIYNIPSGESEVFNKYDKVWTCASSWRPHKRLSENIRYFLENASEEDCLIVAGENPDCDLNYDRVFYAGNLDWPTLISLYKRSSYFLHLAFLDHCPNVVVDAVASGCKVICASSGGTKEIAGPGAVIIEDLEWDFRPLKLYSPPELNFDNFRENDKNSSIDIKKVSQDYYNFFSKVLR